MKTSHTLDELQAEVARQVTTRRDYVIPQNTIAFTAAGPTMGEALAFGGNAFPLTELSHRQLAASLGIPHGFYQKLKGRHPDLLEQTANRFLQESEKGKMVRTLDGQARAFLSDKFLRVDSDQLMAILLAELNDLGLVVESSHVDAERLYVKAFSPKLEGEVAVGDVIQGGFVFGTSEVGLGRIAISPMTLRLVCKNGLVAGSELGAYRRRHVGPRVTSDETGEALNEIAPSFAQMADRIRTSIREALSHKSFQGVLAQMRASKGLFIPSGLDLEVFMARLSRFLGLSEAEAGMVLGHLHGEDMNVFGVVQAVTRTAQDVPKYQRATEFEEMGGSLLEITPRQWDALVEVPTTTILAA